MGLLRGIELTLSYVVHALFRLVQLALALAVCGLYAVDIDRAIQAGMYIDGRWICALVITSLSAITALLYLIPCVSRLPMAFAWDATLFVLWMSLFALFGNVFIGVQTEGDRGAQRMKNAVWVDLANAILWLISSVGMLLYWRHNQQKRTSWTGRGKA
ncbi:hypothetical protein PZA11_005359 [Diplocarpon coronariae]|uniref:MARVEL domain-containing protein n=1 Tax=Diplocarpon coronariae TaxID=2795749 RepID=A0A218Z985_9HELO|nr:hypothetical protein B2J93_7243 [Marssonina coronariae]